MRQLPSLPPRKLVQASRVNVGALPASYKWTSADYRSVIDAAKKIGVGGINPEWLLMVLYGESSLYPGSTHINADGTFGAVGLDQITKTRGTAMGLDEATRNNIPNMTPAQQMPLIVRSFQSIPWVKANTVKSAHELYLANFAPAHLPLYDTYINDEIPRDGIAIYGEGSKEYNENSGLDLTDPKGLITTGDLRAYLIKRTSEAAFQTALKALRAEAGNAPSPPNPNPSPDNPPNKVSADESNDGKVFLGAALVLGTMLYLGKG